MGNLSIFMMFLALQCILVGGVLIGLVVAYLIHEKDKRRE